MFAAVVLAAWLAVTVSGLAVSIFDYLTISPSGGAVVRDVGTETVLTVSVKADVRLMQWPLTVELQASSAVIRLDKCKLTFTNESTATLTQTVRVLPGLLVSAGGANVTGGTLQAAVLLSAQFCLPANRTSIEASGSYPVQRRFSDAAVCAVYGDPQITTFDKAPLDTYVKSPERDYVVTKVGSLTVVSRFTACGTGMKYSCATGLAFKYGTFGFSLTNATIASLSSATNMSGSGVTLRVESNSIVTFTFPNGFEIRVVGEESNTLLSIYVTAPGTFAGKTFGVCGNFDGDKYNDFIREANKNMYEVTDNCNYFSSIGNCPPTDISSDTPGLVCGSGSSFQEYRCFNETSPPPKNNTCPFPPGNMNACLVCQECPPMWWSIPFSYDPITPPLPVPVITSSSIVSSSTPTPSSSDPGTSTPSLSSDVVTSTSTSSVGSTSTITCPNGVCNTTVNLDVEIDTSYRLYPVFSEEHAEKACQTALVSGACGTSEEVNTRIKICTNDALLMNDLMATIRVHKNAYQTTGSTLLNLMKTSSDPAVQRQAAADFARCILSGEACQSNPCKNGGECLGNGCRCVGNYIGPRCETNAQSTLLDLEEAHKPRSVPPQPDDVVVSEANLRSIVMWNIVLFVIICCFNQ